MLSVAFFSLMVTQRKLEDRNGLNCDVNFLYNSASRGFSGRDLILFVRIWRAARMCGGGVNVSQIFLVLLCMKRYRSRWLQLHVMCGL